MLMDDGNALALAVGGAEHFDGHAILQNLSGVRLVNAAQHLDQGAFAGTVLACQGVNPSCV
jgi:hypothetical protein